MLWVAAVDLVNLRLLKKRDLIGQYRSPLQTDRCDPPRKQIALIRTNFAESAFLSSFRDPFPRPTCPEAGPMPNTGSLGKTEQGNGPQTAPSEPE